jgi:Type III restriction enzyme, res subunit
MSARRISEPKGFQLATAEAALETLTRKDGPRRFLVADEVGLGKTVVARTIISELIKRRRRPLVVFYVSSNLNIAHQNRAKLLELLPTETEQKEASAAAADRLTLAANPRNRPKHEKLHLYTLTPDTSLPMYRRRGGFGRIEERALIFRLLKGRFPSLDTDWFSLKCQGNQAQQASWNWALQQHEQIEGIRELQNHFVDALASDQNLKLRVS